MKIHSHTTEISIAKEVVTVSYTHMYGTAPGTVPAGPSPETPKVVVKTKEDTPEFEHYFNTPGDL